jgi:hypothetical protein
MRGKIQVTPHDKFAPLVRSLRGPRLLQNQFAVGTLAAVQNHFCHQLLCRTCALFIYFSAVAIC